MSIYKDIHIYYNIYNTPPWMSINNMMLDALGVVLLKTLSGNKNHVGKNNPGRRRKRVQRAYVLGSILLDAPSDEIHPLIVANFMYRK